MKKLLALAALVILSGCGQTVNEVQSASLYEKGLEIVSDINEEINSDGYVNMLGGFTVTESEILKQIRAEDRFAPDKLYKLTLKAEAIDELMETAGMDIPEEGFSDEMKTILEKRAASAWISSLVFANANSTEKIMLLNILNASRLFDSTELESDCIYIYGFKDGHPIYVSFIKGEGNAVNASGNIILSDVDMTSAETLAKSLSNSFFEAGDLVEIEELTIPAS